MSKIKTCSFSIVTIRKKLLYKKFSYVEKNNKKTGIYLFIFRSYKYFLSSCDYFLLIFPFLIIDNERRPTYIKEVGTSWLIFFFF